MKKNVYTHTHTRTHTQSKRDRDRRRQTENYRLIDRCRQRKHDVADIGVIGHIKLLKMSHDTIIAIHDFHL